MSNGVVNLTQYLKQCMLEEYGIEEEAVGLWVHTKFKEFVSKYIKYSELNSKQIDILLMCYSVNKHLLGPILECWKLAHTVRKKPNMLWIKVLQAWLWIKAWYEYYYEWKTGSVKAMQRANKIESRIVKCVWLVAFLMVCFTTYQSGLMNTAWEYLKAYVWVGLWSDA